ncbi:IkappaB kinase complex, IKAP component [Cutaneotrichosporon oleaginosum]|uniref:Elongator complex protein 1 n=1 Tax=Cutaneotrichosporon oleaginosum TaxID=879819 RepID=A0A0J0XZL2_9TREE|nr:IkappaB kinase complex, IKAP component [Cutaneotrichosporon oleaginosum]KLT46470.1 IkappaB kinase complex, IKAP component [Cutaneotrichosporon oleaginosum]TXT15162.1 hypothetical protein COLE_01355 [Cutaneotrichosporon oleaginosum]
MRSLTPTTVQVASVAASSPGRRGAAIAVDPESGNVYAAVERIEEGEVHVEIVSLKGLEDGGAFADVVASFSSPVLAPFKWDGPQTLSLQYFADDRSVIVLLAGGDIAVIQLEDPAVGVLAEVVGSVDSGIKAAAWSPDDEQLVLVTGEDNLVCMTRSFDTIYEGPLRSDDFGEDKLINVGWGSEGTQFHGSLGKKALLAAQESSKAPKPKAFSHPTDDGLPRITFKGDASYLAVSSLDPYPSGGARRQVRVYSRDAASGFAPRLSATSEALAGLEAPVAWRPVGNVIAGLVRYGYEGGGEGRKGRWDVAMLERNGLRHGGFELREAESSWEGAHVVDMMWNAESDVLAIWLRRSEADVVQLWTMKNYHYYLKQEIPSPRRFVAVRWHPEAPMSLYLIGEHHVQVRSFVWDTYTARLSMPEDTATVAVVDGDRLLITPFRTQNTPPPMSSYTLSLPTQVVHVSMSPSEDALAVLMTSGVVQVWDLATSLPEAGASRLRAGGKVSAPKLRWERSLAPDGEFAPKQVALGGDGTVAALFWGNGPDGAVLRTADANEAGMSVLHDTDWVLWDREAGFVVVDRDGILRSVDEAQGVHVTLCRPAALAISAETRLVFALSDSGRLHAGSLAQRDSVLLASGVTSFTLTPDFCIFTTTQRSYYAPLFAVEAVLAGESLESVKEREWDERRVERGALVVAACPSNMALVLQMPRGNLETVYPRPLVLAVVRRDILAGAYRSAFLTCRKHRLDLNILYDLDPQRLMDALPQFVEQIPEPEFLNLFVSQLNSDDTSIVLYKDLKRDAGRAPVPTTKVNDVCDALRVLVESDTVKYVETILTTHVCKQPPDYEAGLRVLLHVQKEHPEIAQEAIKYIIFLSNVNQLFDVALGMYDFQLVLMVAQYSQKDPKEYLPFLRELRALDKHEQRFRIDDHLGRRESALRNLHAAGSSRFDDAASYLSRYELWDEAFRLYNAEELRTVQDLYGDYLYDRREFHDAAISYALGGKREKALKAYEKAHAWRELFTLARELDTPPDAIASMVERVSDYLASRGRHAEAGQVLIDYAEDVDGAVEVLCRGAEFAEAYRHASRHARPDLVDDVITPALEEAQEALVETLEEMDEQLDKELRRLDELRNIRRTDPDEFYLVENDVELENVDVATNATTVATAFTRYTVAPTTAFSQSTRMTGQTTRSKNRPSKKRQAGRKGTVDEYDYLVASIGRLVKRVDDKSGEALSLLRPLATSPHRDLASALQNTVVTLRAKLARALDNAWSDRETILEGVETSGGNGLGGNATAARALERPIVAPWKGLARLV